MSARVKLNLQGQTLSEALGAVKPKLNKADRQAALRNADQIISIVAKTYDTRVKAGEVGKGGTGPRGKIASKSDKSRAGLIYGRIQSGKTRAMITSAALAFDNKFRVVVVVTSNNNRLVVQTHQDFRNGLPGNIGVYSKAHFEQEVAQAKQILQSGQGGIVLICSKGAARLPQAIEFLRKTGANQHPAVIFDDEGDQATLDTNTLKRSRKQKNTLIPASKIHQLIHNPAIFSLRRALPRNIFVSVTGTPSGIVLQNLDNKSRPAFIELLEAGKDYVGGNFFFAKEKPETDKLVTLVDGAERIKLLGKKGSVLPEGLKSAIRFFLLAAAAAGSLIGWPGDDRGYKLLCHPSVKNADQEKVAKLVRQYIVNLSDGIASGSVSVLGDFKKSYDSLKNQTPSIPSLASLLAIIRMNMPSREILILNKNTTGDELNYSRYFNILIGGNTLGRGLAIKNLLVTYYVREAKTTQMDTMYQHARMFGYRKSTLPFTRVFLPPQLYGRFRQIFISDEDLRKFIDENKGGFDTFPVRIAANIRATRRCVLDARKVEVLVPGTQIYPNYPFFEGQEAKAVATRVRKKLSELFPTYVADGRTGKRVSTAQAQQIVSLAKTGGTNVWTDRKVPAIFSYLGQKFKNGVILKYRKANRTAGDDMGLLEQGVLTGADVISDSSGSTPVLWIIEMKFKDDNAPSAWNGSEFFYPTVVLPRTSPLVVFNKS